MGELGAAQRALRGCLVGAAVSAELAAWLSGALALSWLLVGLGALAIAVLVSGQATTSVRARELRVVATGGAVGAVAIGLTVASAPVDGLRRVDVLAVVLALVLASTALTWRSPAEARTGLLCVVGLLVAAAATAPDLVVAPFLLAGWVLALLAVLQLAPARVEADPRVAGPVAVRAVRPAGPVGLAVALALLAGLLLPLPAESSWQPPPASDPGDPAQQSAAATADDFTSPRMDLRGRPGSPDDQPLLEVPSGSPPLWRSTVYGDYDGAGWEATAGEAYTALGPPFVVDSRPGGRADDVDVLLPTATVWAPGDVLSVDARAGAAFVDASGVRLDRHVRRYRVDSAPVSRSDAELLATGAPAPDGSRWLSLPAALPQRVRDLSAELTAGARSQHEAVTAVRDHLRSRYTYRLDVPVPGLDEDAVDRFLFVDRTGFCQQFASAHAVLLRAAGIPARVVTGLGYGIDRGSRREYQVKHLHAWVEVHYPGVGWVPSDATAAADLARGDATLRDRAATRAERAVETARERLFDREFWLWVLVLVLATGIAGLVLRRVLRRRPHAAVRLPSVPAGAGPALAAFLRLDARLGPRGRRSAESLRELRDRTGPPVAVGAALGVVEQECYAASPPADAEHAAAVLDAVDVDAMHADGPGVRTVLPRQRD